MKKDIIFIVNSLKNPSGVERVVTELANALCHSHHLEIINRDTDTIETAAYPINKNIKITRFKGSLLLFFLLLKTYLSKRSADVIVVHNMGKLSLFVALIPLKMRLWSYEHVARASRSFWINFLGRFLYKRYEKVFTLTKEDAKSYQEIGISVSLMYNPSPFPLYSSYDSKSKHIIAIGRLVPQKRFDVLIKSWVEIFKKYPDWQLTIYGEGKDNDLLLSLIKRYGLTNIYLNPAVDDVSAIYKTASFYVMSSKYEGLPMVLIEAQTYSLPIISFDCPHGPSEIITHDKDGFLIANQDEKALAMHIERLIVNEQLRIEFSKEAYFSAQRFNKDQIINKWDNLLKLQE